MNGQAAKDHEQESAEAEVDAFTRRLGPFVVAVDSTRMAMAFTDARRPDNPIIFANKSFLDLTGYDRTEVLAQSFDFILPPQAAAQARAEIEAAFTTSPAIDAEIRFRRKDGSEGWASLFVTPVRNEQGAIVQHFLSLADTTRYKLAEQNAALLIDELNHRVKNTLATVQAMVSQAFRGALEPREIRRSVDAHLRALSHAHDLLSRNSWEGVGLCDLLAEIVGPSAQSAHAPDRHSLTGANLRLRPNATISLGIALNELLSNAIKFGALANDDGSISVDWKLEARPDAPWLALRWCERGGPRVVPPMHKGFGSRVIERGLPHELGGNSRLDYAPDGLVCTIDIPAHRALLDA